MCVVGVLGQAGAWGEIKGLLQRGWGNEGVWAGTGALMWKCPLRGGRLE